MRSRRAAITVLLIGAALAAAGDAHAQPGVARIRVLGLAVDLDTRPDVEGLQSTMTAVKDIPTGLETFLGSPADPAVRSAPPGALVKARLRGPSFGSDAVEIAAPPNQLLELPLFRIAGAHQVSDVRLEDAEGQVLLERDPAADPIRIDVIDELLVTSVTTRPLTLEEIQERGIVIDEDNFTALNFVVGLTLGSEQVSIDLPVLIPTSQQALASPETPRMIALGASPEQLRRINIPNLSLAGFSMRGPPELETDGLSLPAIHGVLVIPGNIAFLNQFFSVILQATNAAPAGSGLTVRAARATIALPKGEDGIARTGDDPLRVAETVSGGVRAELPLVDAAGSAAIAPQGTNAAEFLVEGLREGTHRVDFDLRGELFVPALGRAVEMTGLAAGVVQVRNPTFSIVLAHPRVVREGEEYGLFATVTNTSSSPANLFRLELARRSLSGARLADGETGLRTLEQLRPGEAESFEFRLVARTTGEVTGTVFLAEEGINGSFVLTTGVGDLGIPLSPDTLVLPQTVDSLPDEPDFVAAAVRVLGMAYSVATAPARALPAAVARVSRAHVFERAVKLAQAGLHVRFGETQEQAVEDVLLDWYGNDRGRVEAVVPDEAERGAFLRDTSAFDALRRGTDAGHDFDAIAGAVLGQALSAGGSLAALQRGFGERFASRPAALSFGVSARGSPVVLELRAADGARLGRLDPAAPEAREIPYAARLPLARAAGVQDELVLVASPEPGTGYTLALAAPAGAAGLDLTAVVPRSSDTAFVAFPQVALAAGGSGRLVVAAGGEASLEVDADGDGVVETRLAPLAVEPIADRAPALLGVQQWAKGSEPWATPSFELGDPIGRLVGVLFDEEVSAATAAAAAAYAVPDNAVLGVTLQPDRRLAFVVLEKPIGPFVPRALTVRGVADLRGNALGAETRAIAADPERGTGGRFSGRVVTAAGEPIPFAEVRYIQPLEADGGLFECFPKDFAIATYRADAEGRFAIDFVLQNGLDDVCTPDVWLNQRDAGGTNHFKLEAADPETGEVGRLSTRVQFDGQHLALDLVIRGFGAIEGRVFDEAGQLVTGGDPGTPRSLQVFARNLSTGELLAAWVDADGRYAFPRRFVDENGRRTEAAAPPVGNLALLVARPSDGATAVTTVNLPAAGARVTQDLVLLPPFRFGEVSGVVLESDGVTPAANVAVYLAGRVLTGVGFAGRSSDEGLIDATVTDAAGVFRFENVPAGNVTVAAQRASTFEEARGAGVVPEGGAARLALVLPGTGGTVRGIVLDAFGNPLPGATVAGGVTLTSAGAGGRFEIRGLPRGTVTVYGQGSGSPALGKVSVTTRGPDDVQEVVIRLEPVGTVTGTVFEADGVTPIPVQKVQLWFEDKAVIAETFTDGEGTFTFRSYPVARYSVRAIRRPELDGGQAATEIRFAGDTRDADVVFRGLGEISGRVVQSNGTPAIADVLVTRKVWRIIPDTAGLPVDNAALGLAILQQFAQIPGLEGAVARAISENGLDQPAPEFFLLTDETAVLRSDRLGPGGEVTGRFHFAGDATGGPFTVAAFGPFLAPAVVKGEIPRTANPDERRVDVGDIVLEPATGAVRGTVYLPDGVTPVGANVAVRLRSFDTSGTVPAVGGGVSQPVLPEIEVVTDEEGRFAFPLVLRGSFGLTADTGAPPPEIRATTAAEMQTEAFEDEAGNRLLNVRLFGEARGSVPVLEVGQFVTVDVRLRDVAGARVRVVGPDGTTPVEGARVAVATSSTLDADPPAAFTDENGEVGFFPLIEGPFSAAATLLGDPRRAAGTVVVPENGPNGLELPLTLALGAVTTASGEIVAAQVFGSVAGTLLRADGTPLENPAEVRVTASGVAILTTSGPDGRYLAENVPGGFVRVDVFEPLTARRGAASGTLAANGQTVEIPVTLVGLGTVTGSVLASDGGRALPGVDIELAASGSFSDRLVTRSDASGVYLLPGVPLGAYTVRANDFATGLSGSASGALRRDGDLVTTDVALEPSGGIAGVVYGPGVVVGADGQPRRADGSPFPGAPRVAGVALEIRRGGQLVQTVQSGPDGGFRSGGFLPVGDYELVARAPLAEDGATRRVRIRFDAEIAEGSLALAGTGAVEGVVLDSLGQAPVAGTSVTFASESRFSAGPRSRITDAEGRFAFEDVALGAFSISVRTNLQVPTLGGGASGSLAGAGARIVFADGDADPEHEAIRLQEAGSVAARILLADGVTPAEGAVAFLEGDESGVRFSRPIGGDGRLRLDGIPLGAYRLAVREPVTNAVARRLVAIAANGELVDLGDVLLDARAPRVVGTEPGVSAAGVAPGAAILVRFDEAIDPASLGEESFAVRVAGEPVDGTRELREGGLAAAFVPAAPLPDLQRVEVELRADEIGFEGEVIEPGVRDLAGVSLASDFRFSFTTGDTVPPALRSASPADGAVEVDARAVVRLEFSEPLDPASIAGFTLRDGAGAPVAGQRNAQPILGGRVHVFTPAVPLAPNETYTATLQGPVRDLAGNAMAEPAIAMRFTTLDTRPPALASLAVTAGAPLVTGRTITLTAALAEDEPGARVEFTLGGALIGVDTTPPFAQEVFLAPSLGAGTTVRAMAVDAVGNRSAPRDLALAIAPNQPPVVTLVAPVSGTVSQGDVVTVDVAASDDVGLAELRFLVDDGAVASGAQPAAGASGTARFTFTVPPAAPVGSPLAVRAVAVDALGLAGSSAAAQLGVEDALAPAVTIGSPAPGATVSPGGTLTVLVRADDAGGVASLRLLAPAFGFDETRPIAPAAPTAQATFTVPVPADAAAGNATLTARATDAGGNEGTRLLAVRVADANAPAVRLSTATGTLLVEPGRDALVDVAADDDVGVVRIELAVAGQAPQVRTIPANRSARERFTIAVPAGLALGATLPVSARAADAAGNTGTATPLNLVAADGSPPALAIVEPVADALVPPGAALSVRVTASDLTGVAAIALSTTGAVTSSETRPFAPPVPAAEETFSVAVPANAPAGAVIALGVSALDADGRLATASRTVRVADVIVPSVVGVDPADGAVEVDPGAVLRVTFGEPVAAASVTAASLSLTCGGSAVAGSFAFASGGALVTLTPAAPLPAGAACAVAVSAGVTDLAGNPAVPFASGFGVHGADGTPPVVTAVEPADGAIGVALGTAVRIAFSEPIAAATVGAASVVLETTGGAAVAAARTLESGGTVVAVTPAAPLAPSTAYRVRVTTAVTDLAGNALATAFASSFTTTGPDLAGPRLTSLEPAAGATGVSVRPLVRACFDEALDPASVGAASLRVLDVAAGRTPVAAERRLEPGERCLVVEVAAPLAFAADHEAVLAGSLRGADGNPVTDPAGAPFASLVHGFRTGAFAIVAPVAGRPVIERTPLPLEAAASAGLGVASVVFTVNGTALAPVAGPPFRATAAVPAFASAPTLTVVASGRDAGGAEIATASLSVPIVVGLRFDRLITGVPLGAGALRLVASSPPLAALDVDLAAFDPAIVSVPARVVFPAGGRELVVPVTGLAEGGTAVVATSAQGETATVASVSEPAPPAAGSDSAVVAAPVGASLRTFGSAGQVVLAPGEARTVRVRLLDAPAAAPTPVLVTSSAPAVADAAAAATIAAGATEADLPILAGVAGEAVFVIRAGASGRELRVAVGAPPPDRLAPTVAPPVGALVLGFPSLGEVILPAGSSRIVTLPLLDAPAAMDLSVVVTTSDPAVAAVLGNVVVPAGATTATFAITTGTLGEALLTLRFGDGGRELRAVVGTPDPARTPPVVAPPVGALVIALPSAGNLIVQPGAARTLTLPLLGAPAARDIPVTVTSSNPAVAAVFASVVVPAGATAATFEVTAGAAGEAVLTLLAGREGIELRVVVGTPDPARTPPVVAPPVGLAVLEAGNVGTLYLAPGAARTVTLELLSFPSLAALPVQALSQAPVVATASPAMQTLAAGARSVPLTVTAGGAPGETIVELRFGVERRTLAVVVGGPAPERAPTTLAPPVGVEVEGP